MSKVKVSLNGLLILCALNFLILGLFTVFLALGYFDTSFKGAVSWCTLWAMPVGMCLLTFLKSVYDVFAYLIELDEKISKL